MATYKFFPPVIDEQPVWWEPEVLLKFSWPRGISLIKSESGLFEQTRYFQPQPDWVEGVDYFVGGFRYSNISQDVADLLVASGYEPEVEDE